MLSRRFLEESQRSFLVTDLGDKAFQNLTLVVGRAPEAVPLPVDLHENLVEMPFPVARSNPFDPTLLDLVGEHRPEPVPPVADRLVTDIDASFMKEVFDIPQREREPQIEHHRETDDLGAGLELAEWGAFGHARTLSAARPRLKLSSSDRATGKVDPEGMPQYQGCACSFHRKLVTYKNGEASGKSKGPCPQNEKGLG